MMISEMAVLKLYGVEQAAPVEQSVEMSSSCEGVYRPPRNPATPSRQIVSCQLLCPILLIAKPEKTWPKLMARLSELATAPSQSRSPLEYRTLA
jgi:hypothetical protein